MNKIIAEIAAEGLHIPYSVFAQLGGEIGTKIMIEFDNKQSRLDMQNRLYLVN